MTEQQTEERQERQQDEQEVDAQGKPLDMSAHIPEDTPELPDHTDTNDMSVYEVDEDDLDQSAKLNDLEGGIHPNSVTFGTVYSDYESDGADQGPEEFAAMGITDPDEVDAPELDSPATKEPSEGKSSKSKKRSSQAKVSDRR
jgi:hypothetical protein